MTRIIVEYNILRAEDVPKLTRNVMAAIRDGWEPLGAVTYSYLHTTGMYMQAVVRYEEQAPVVQPPG